MRRVLATRSTSNTETRESLATMVGKYTHKVAGQVGREIAGIFNEILVPGVSYGINLS